MAKGNRLVENGKLLRLIQTDDLGRRMAEKLLERSGQMRLIEIASLSNGVEDRTAFNPWCSKGSKDLDF